MVEKNGESTPRFIRVFPQLKAMGSLPKSALGWLGQLSGSVQKEGSWRVHTARAYSSWTTPPYYMSSPFEVVVGTQDFWTEQRTNRELTNGSYWMVATWIKYHKYQR